MFLTRTEHLKWCKEKALTTVKEDKSEQIAKALEIYILELGTHPETKNDAAIAILQILKCSGRISTRDELEYYLSEII